MMLGCGFHEENDNENNHNRGIAHLIYDGLAMAGDSIC